MDRDVVITGLGAVTPLGTGVDAYWDGFLAGRSGVRRIATLGPFAPERYRSQVAGQVPDLDLDATLVGDTRDLAERVGRYAQLALVAAEEAMTDSGLDISAGDPHRVGVWVGAGMGAMVMGETEIEKLYSRDRPDRVHPNFVPTIMLNSASGIVSMAHDARGPNLTISTACSSSAHALGQALHALRSGQAEAAIVVGADSSITPLVFGGFCSMRAMSTGFNDDPGAASRPFDEARDGFVMGEGAGALILETAAHAQARGATARGRVLGYAARGEAHHLVTPREDGVEIAHVMRAALADARVNAADIDLVSAHATSTPVGDPAEARAMREVFGPRVDEVAVTATKSLIGHTLGASAALAAVAGLRSIETGLVPGTRNLTAMDPECALGGLCPEVRESRVNRVLINAFGFGSNNACVVIGGLDDDHR